MVTTQAKQIGRRGAHFPISPSQVVTTLAEICRLRGEAELATILSNARGRIIPTSAEGDRTEYALCLDVALPVYVPIEGRITHLQWSIEARLGSINRNTGNRSLHSVVIRPALVEIADEAPKPLDARHIWQPGMIRLFVSHVSAHKVPVSNLKRCLGFVGISAFVAHKDIEPSREWQGEILAALATMDALVALLTVDFHQSSWTDQEVGAAVMRGTPLVPVDLGMEPYGFLARYQSLPGSLSQPRELAASLAICLARNPITSSATKEALIRAIESTSSISGAIAASLVIEGVGTFTEDQLARIEAAMKSNSKVGGAGGAAPRIRRFLSTARAAAG